MRHWKERMEEFLNDKDKYDHQTCLWKRGFVVVKFPDNSIYLGYSNLHDIVSGNIINLFENSLLRERYGNIMTSFIMYSKILKSVRSEFQPNLNNFSIKDLDFVEICLCKDDGQVLLYNGVGYKYNKQEYPFTEKNGFIYRIDNELDFIPDWLMYYFEKSNIHLDKEKVVYEI